MNHPILPLALTSKSRFRALIEHHLPLYYYSRTLREGRLRGDIPPHPSLQDWTDIFLSLRAWIRREEAAMTFRQAERWDPVFGQQVSQRMKSLLKTFDETVWELDMVLVRAIERDHAFPPKVLVAFRDPWAADTARRGGGVSGGEEQQQHRPGVAGGTGTANNINNNTRQNPPSSNNIIINRDRTFAMEEQERAMRYHTCIALDNSLRVLEHCVSYLAGYSGVLDEWFLDFELARIEVVGRGGRRLRRLGGQMNLRRLSDVLGEELDPVPRPDPLVISRGGSSNSNSNSGEGEGEGEGSVSPSSLR